MKENTYMRLAGLALLAGSAGVAEANLIGVTLEYPAVRLNNTYLIYDNNGINRYTGLLKVVSFGSTLDEGPGYGGSTQFQSYAGGSDTTPELMLTFAINRYSGALVNSNDPSINKVSIGFGNAINTNTPRFNWQGDINGFGWQENIGGNSSPYEYGTKFDGTWQMTQDSYQNLPADMSQFVDGVLTAGMTGYNGGIKISNSAGFGNVPQGYAFQRDWVFGIGANQSSVQSLLSPFLSGLSSSSCRRNTSTKCVSYVHSLVSADVFVPIPPAVWLWGGALATLLPSVRRIKNHHSFRSA